MNTKNKLAEHKNRCSKFVLCVKKTLLKCIVPANLKFIIGIDSTGEKGFAPQNKRPATEKLFIKCLLNANK